MRKVFSISLTFCLTGITALLLGAAIELEAQKIVAHTDIEADTISENENMLYVPPFSALLLSEIMADNDSEIEPKESGFVSVATVFDSAFGITAYLRKSKLILISLKILDLIYPFHTHL